MKEYARYEFRGRSFGITSENFAHLIRRKMPLGRISMGEVDIAGGRRHMALYHGHGVENAIVGWWLKDGISVDAIMGQHNGDPGQTTEGKKIMKYKVETGIEVPSGWTRGVVEFEYPFKDMAVGDSFFIPMERGDFSPPSGQKIPRVQGRISRVRALGYKYRDLVDKTFAMLIRMRSMELSGECGIRVWRVAPKGDGHE